jgi:hypothetical protein
MVCETRLRPRQTAAERSSEIRRAIDQLSQGLASGRIRAKVGPQGAIAFDGWNERDGITDACAYRKIMASGSSAAKLSIAKAEQIAGRTVDRKVLTQGFHSHDGGDTWHSGH